MEDKCKLIREKILNDVKKEIERLNIQPTLCVINCSNDDASKIYIRNKLKTCESVGIKTEFIKLEPQETDLNRLINIILDCNTKYNGVMLQLPIDEKFKEKEHMLLNLIDSKCDIDGLGDKQKLKLINNNKDALIPCTVKGIELFLKYNNIDICGKNIVIIGRSEIVGKPMARLMLNNNATVTICHSKTKNVRLISKNADILIVAIGKPKMINHEYVKNGAIVIDVGINRDENNKVCGDCDYDDLKNITSLITPVPKGVGILTTSIVAYNTLKAYKLQNGLY